MIAIADEYMQKMGFGEQPYLVYKREGASVTDGKTIDGTDFGYIMRYSLYKTLARKFNSTLRKVIRKYTKNNEFVIPYKDVKGNKKFRVLYHDGFKHKTNAFHKTCDIIPNTHFPKRSLAERLRANVCELCGENGSLVMHHARTLKSIKGETPWGKQMLFMNRKTIAVCEECFVKIKEIKQ